MNLAKKTESATVSSFTGRIRIRSIKNLPSTNQPWLIVDIRHDTSNVGFLPGSLDSQSQGDGGELLDAVEPELNILVSQLVYQHGNRVQGVIPSVVGHSEFIADDG